MSDKSKKKMCKFDKKDIEKNLDTIIALVKNPKYICKKCGRVAVSKSNLCKPTKLE